MSNDTTIHNVHVFSVERKNNSRNGNPTWLLRTDHGNYTTQTDGSIGYTINNLTNGRFPDTYAIGDGAPAVDLLVSGRGHRVIGMLRNGKHLR